jgi:hypothetical protein
LPACWSGDFVVAQIHEATGGAGNTANGGASATGGRAGSAPGGSETSGAGGASEPSCTGHALFVVGTDPLTSGDTAILDRLRGLGFVVSITSATMVTTASAQGMDFCFISRSVHSPEVNASFRDQPIALFVTEYNLYASLGMTESVPTSSGGDTLTSTELTILDPAHPLAAGFSGNVTVLGPGKGQYGWGVPGPGAAVIANLVGEAQGAAVFGYEQGAPMFGLTAPARRVGYFLDIQASTRLTADGWTMFDAAVQWVAGTCATR